MKKNDTWSMTLETDGTGLVDPDGAFGYTMLQISDNKILVAATYDGFSANEGFGSGSFLSLDRGLDGTWKFTARIQPEVRDRQWGLALLKTDTELLVWGCVTTKILVDAQQMIYSYQTICGFSVIPQCFNDPIEVTCSNQELQSCSDLTKISFDELYTVQNPGCGVAKSPESVSFGSSGLEISFEFSRFGVPLASCNATLTCPAIPSGVGVTPVIDNSPPSQLAPGAQPSPQSAVPVMQPSAQSAVPIETPNRAEQSVNDAARPARIDCTAIVLVLAFLTL